MREARPDKRAVHRDSRFRSLRPSPLAKGALLQIGGGSLVTRNRRSNKVSAADLVHTPVRLVEVEEVMLGQGLVDPLLHRR